MAVLSNPDRVLCVGRTIDEATQSQRTWGAGCEKPSVRNLINAVDDWLDANSNAANQAIPQPERTNFTSKQKFLALAIVALRRAEIL